MCLQTNRIPQIVPGNAKQVLLSNALLLSFHIEIKKDMTLIWEDSSEK